MSTRQKNPPWWPTREQKARADLSVHPDLRVLSDASPDALVDAVIRLTHSIHAYHITDQEGPHAQQLADLRAQRDLCRAELIRRAGA